MYFFIIIGVFDHGQINQILNSHTYGNDSGNNVKIILVEPRKKVIDDIRFALPKSVDLVAKMITDSNTFSEKVLHEYIRMEDNSGCIYTTNFQSSKVNDEDVLYKERVYTTSFKNIINEYRIHQIEKIIWNLNMDDWSECLETIAHYNNIIKSVDFNYLLTNFDYKKSQFLNNYFERSTHIPEIHSFVNKKIRNNIVCPKILTIFIKNLQEKHTPQFNLLKKHYDIEVINDTKTKTLFDSKKKYIYEKIHETLDNLFTCNENESDDSEVLSNQIIVLFNPDILSKNFQIMYPIEDAALYINRDLDLIYSSRNNMFLLYEIIKSESFVEHMDSIKREKKEVMFRIFQKRHFYDYIERNFKVINI